jgi:riboflavin kinase/FMN adenylyltransferase
VQRWRGLEAAPPDWRRCVVTVGVFDGVHRGHQQIVGRALARARAAGQPAVVLSFDPHPSEVVRPGSHPPVLTTARFKADLLEALGVDVLCVQPFTPEFSRLSPEAFVHRALVEQLHASAVVVGENFRYGHKAAGDLTALHRSGRMFGFAVEGVPLLCEDDTQVSSTHVRTCVAGGDLAAANRALGRPHRVEGVVVRGDERGRDLGYPTANVQATAYAAVPADGVYAGFVSWRSHRRAAAISIGTNPTFEGRERRVEAYVLDFHGDLYGEHVAVEFVQRLRGTETFASAADLVEQMARDVAEVRRLLPA